MRKAKILTKDTEDIAETHKETVHKLINLPVSLRFDEGEFPNVFTKYLTDEITVKEPEEQKIKTEEKKILE